MQSTKKNLQLALRGYFSHKDLPWIYTGGFVRRDAIEDLIKRRGSVFKSISPDLCSAMSLSLQEEKYLYLHEPIAIGGTSGFSNGRTQMKSTEKNNILREFYEESSIGFLPELGDGHVQSLPLLVFEAFKVNACDFNDVKINSSLSYQLALALIKSKKGFEYDVERYCRAVAQHNGVRWSKVTAMEYYRRYWSPLVRRFALSSGLGKPLFVQRNVESRDGVAENIYSATREALSITSGVER